MTYRGEPGEYAVRLAARSMRDAGYELIQSGAGYGLDGDGAFGYFETERDLNMVVEIIERPKRRRPLDATWPE